MRCFVSAEHSASDLEYAAEVICEAVGAVAATALHPSESWRFFTARLWERAATYPRFENASAMVAVDAAADLLRAFGVNVSLGWLKIVTNGGFLILLGVVALVDWRRRGRCRARSGRMRS